MSSTSAKQQIAIILDTYYEFTQQQHTVYQHRYDAQKWDQPIVFDSDVLLIIQQYIISVYEWLYQHESFLSHLPNAHTSLLNGSVCNTNCLFFLKNANVISSKKYLIFKKKIRKHTCMNIANMAGTRQNVWQLPSCMSPSMYVDSDMPAANRRQKR